MMGPRLVLVMLVVVSSLDWASANEVTVLGSPSERAAATVEDNDQLGAWNQCQDVAGPICPAGHLFLTSIKSNKPKCKPLRAGNGCKLHCAVTAVKYGNACKNTWAFSHHSHTSGPACWHWAFPDCLGSRQSPINIVTSKAHRTFYPTRLMVYTNVKPQIRINNNGHALEADLKKNPLRVLYASGGVLGSNSYNIAQFHFHFASKGEGSEHTINGKGRNAEMHIVMWNAKYSCVKVAKQYCDGLAVIAVMLSDKFYTGARNAKGANHVVTQKFWDNLLGNVGAKQTYCGSTSKYFSVDFADLLPSSFSSHYYTYKGSLTTPPCSEAVTWIVLKQGFHVSKATLTKLAKVYSNAKPAKGHTIPHAKLSHMSGNKRPVQPLHGRHVYHVGFP